MGVAAFTRVVRPGSLVLLVLIASASACDIGHPRRKLTLVEALPGDWGHENRLAHMTISRDRIKYLQDMAFPPSQIGRYTVYTDAYTTDEFPVGSDSLILRVCRIMAEPPPDSLRGYIVFGEFTRPDTLVCVARFDRRREQLTIRTPHGNGGVWHYLGEPKALGDVSIHH